MAHTPEQNPVVLVHGIDDTASKMARMQRFLEAEGWVAASISLSPNNGDAGLESLAEQLAEFIDETFGNQRFVDLIGFSMGGLVTRYYVQRLGGIHRVQRFLTISSPHHGTWVGYLRQNRGASQMRPSSHFLNELNQDVDMLDQLQFTSMWTPFDLMILPTTSSRLPVGDELQVPVLLHPWMVGDRRCLRAIAIRLTQPLLESK